jgi:hypothetical protein
MANKNYDKFRQDMQAAGREVEEYSGRDFYEGPSVQIDRDELQTIIRETTVRLLTDRRGKSDLVVYPAD